LDEKRLRVRVDECPPGQVLPVEHRDVPVLVRVAGEGGGDGSERNQGTEGAHRYSLVIVSSRFRMTRATMVNAAASMGVVPVGTLSFNPLSPPVSSAALTSPF